jgi:hypothetical protein
VGRVAAAVFANPSHWPASTDDHFDIFHIVPASAYFTEPLASQIAARIGSFDGKTLRTVPPIGGTIAVDVPGTAMGFWFNPSVSSYPESAHLAFAPDNVDPSRMAISIGTSLPGWSHGLVWFTPRSAGVINRHPTQITADGLTYCFEVPGSWALVARLLDATTVRVETPPPAVTTCAAALPWTFTANAFDFKR